MEGLFLTHCSSSLERDSQRYLMAHAVIRTAGAAGSRLCCCDTRLYYTYI